MSEKIIVTIDKKGGISYVVQGVKGSGCAALTQAIDALGTVTETKTTNEYCELPAVQAQELEQGK